MTWDVATAERIAELLAAKEPRSPYEIAKALGWKPDAVDQVVSVLHHFDARFERVAGSGCWNWRRVQLAYVPAARPRRRVHVGAVVPLPAPPPRDELCERIVALLEARADTGLGAATTAWLAEHLREHQQDVRACIQRHAERFTTTSDADGLWTRHGLASGQRDTADVSRKA